MSTQQAPETADIFCKVVDNFGDAGIAWRLARALARDHGFAVRLFIDDIIPLAKMKPALDATKSEQVLDGVLILPLPEGEGRGEGLRFIKPDTETPHLARVARHLLPLGEGYIADLVIETLAASLPDNYLTAMAAWDTKPTSRDRLREPQRERPIWILYEYLSAELWVEGTHLKPSPHPRLPLTRTFFYPGFTARTGGLLTEPFITIPPPSTQLKRIFLFGYENDALFKTWLPLTHDIHIEVPEGRALNSIRASFPTLPGNIHPLPFVDQDQMIKNLATYDLNIVRGEDSLTAAVLTGRPLIWHIYPQDEDTHLIKLRAFLARYTANMSPRAAKAVIDLHLAWNGAGNITAAWHNYLIDFIDISCAAADFARQMAQNGNAAQNLVDFYRQKG